MSRSSPEHSLRLRAGAPSDAAAVAAAMRASVRGLAAGAHPAAAIAAWSSLPALYHRWAMTAGGERYVVAERAGRIVGYAAVRAGELTALFVRPREAGRGTGSRLLARAERLAAAGGARILVARAATNAASFYRARGFAGRRAITVPLPGGVRLGAVLLRKRLDG